MIIVRARRARATRAGVDDSAASVRRAAGHLAAALAVSAALAVCTTPTNTRAQSPHPTPTKTGAPSPSEFIGKTAKEISARLGPPTTAEYLQETGGYLLIYAHPGEPHYVFETGPDGRVKRAAVTH